MFDKHLKSQPQTTTTSIETAEIDEKLLPPIDESSGYYMPLYMAYEDDKIDGKSKHLLKISPPEKSNEPNYYSAKPKKVPKKYSSTVKHVNIKREAIPEKNLKEELSSTTEFVAPKMSYDWIPIVGTNHKNSRGNYDIIYGAYENVDLHPPVPETDNNQQDTVKSKVKKVKSRSRRDVYDILSKNERLQYQMHGFGGPKTYKFGYDTEKTGTSDLRNEEMMEA
ncbi:uncharacterized protein LOC129616070 isoform X2 [Condylostylus longicornis]|uniref:uncharacterized protein LOC129616070 isoform X2 n=1 Tax=Condylostylus longicornis TaxID=2530218 RepID=UPI00244E1B6E|nr:uncharacterized protein LOC129616070 isoform X2 [Condylostylus longicornis]